MQNKNLLIGLVVVIFVVLGGVFLYDFILGEPEAASGPLEAVPLQLATLESAPTEAPAVEPTAVVVEATALAEPEVAPTEVAATPTATAAAPTVSAGTITLFEINQNNSQASFTLQEDLRGVRTTVIGVTNQVAGQIAANPADLATAQVGTITINARTFLTDNDFRNNAIRNRILNTDQFEFITFTPTQLVGLPASVEIGQTVSFQIMGNLTIRDITNQVTFDVTATPLSDTELSGTAITIVNRAAYNLVIPSVQGVANVTEEVQLGIDFVAAAMP